MTVLGFEPKQCGSLTGCIYPLSFSLDPGLKVINSLWNFKRYKNTVTKKQKVYVLITPRLPALHFLCQVIMEKNLIIEYIWLKVEHPVLVSTIRKAVQRQCLFRAAHDDFWDTEPRGEPASVPGTQCGWRQRPPIGAHRRDHKAEPCDATAIRRLCESNPPSHTGGNRSKLKKQGIGDVRPRFGNPWCSRNGTPVKTRKLLQIFLSFWLRIQEHWGSVLVGVYF